jgi:membrane associated rhomboid family serine protease
LLSGANLPTPLSHNFNVWFIPASWQEWLQLKGWVLLVVIFTMEIAGLLSRRKITIGRAEIDHLGHLGGFCTGVASGWWVKTNRAKENVRQARELTWYEKLLGKRPSL